MLITGIIRTLIQFNGKLSSSWTNIVVGVLTLVFIGAQSLVPARNARELASRRLARRARGAVRPAPRSRRGRWLALAGWLWLPRSWGAAFVIGGGGHAMPARLESRRRPPPARPSPCAANKPRA